MCCNPSKEVLVSCGVQFVEFNPKKKVCRFNRVQ